jgi:hypothetical protein
MEGTSFPHSGLVVRVYMLCIWYVLGWWKESPSEYICLNSTLTPVTIFMLRCLRVDVNMCLSIPQIGGLAFSLLFRSSEINFLACRRRSSFPMAALGPGIGRCSRERMLVRRRWIYRSFPTSSMGCGGSWSKESQVP